MSNHTNDYPSTPNGYKLLSLIGEGTLGAVWRAKVIEGTHTGEHVAVKKIDLEKCGDSKIDDIRKNMLLVNLLQHPNILSHRANFLSKQNLWLVSEIMEGGSMETIIRNHFAQGIKDQTLIATILKETLQGLAYLHQNSQIHREIKAANILIGADGSVKISDFGVITHLKKHKKRSTLIGSPCWMAPEMFNNETGYDSKADIWSLGITAIELAEGQPPNSELCTMQLLLRTINEEPPRLKSDDAWDEHFQEFIDACLAKDPAHRKSAKDLLKDCKAFFAKAKGKDYIRDKLKKAINITKNEKAEECSDAALPCVDEGSKCRRCKGIEFNFGVNDKETQDGFIENKENVPMNSANLRPSSSTAGKHWFLTEKAASNPVDTAEFSKKELGQFLTRERSMPTCCSKYVHMTKTEHLELSNGDTGRDMDMFGFLNEDEI